MRFLIYLLPVWLVKLLYKTMPPTACFRTTTGRVFRLVKVDYDFCLALSSDKYDKEVTRKLLKMKEDGERMVEAAISGINNLSYDEREKILINRKLKKGYVEDGIEQ